MDEPRGDQPAPESSTHPPIASAAKLAPAQEAYGDYTRHSLRCDQCRDVDRSTCSEGKRLHRAWRALSDAALNAVAGGTA